MEPADIAELPQLLHGLGLLDRADPFVDVRLAENGEHIVAAAGSVYVGGGVCVCVFVCKCVCIVR